MTQKAPGKAYREGISLIELGDMFPDEEAARLWFESWMWPTGRYCPRCGNVRTHGASHKKSPYRCTDCRAYFSVKTGTALDSSKVPLRKWAFAIYLEATSLKGIASMKLHRDIKVTQKTAWFMLHRIREAWAGDCNAFSGPVEVDETYFGGKRANMSNAKRIVLEGRGPVGKTAVVGAKDRKTNRVSAQVVEETDSETANRYSKIPRGHFSNIISTIENQDEFNQMITRRRASSASIVETTSLKAETARRKQQETESVIKDVEIARLKAKNARLEAQIERIKITEFLRVKKTFQAKPPAVELETHFLSGPGIGSATLRN